MQVAEAFVALRPDTKGFEADAKQQLGAPLGRIAAGAATAFAAVKVKDLFTGFIGEAREAERVSRLTEAALKSTGGTANVTAGDISNLAEALSRKAGVDDEVIQSGENVLLTFTAVRNEAGKGNNIFDQGVEAALNLSSALGTDLQGSIMLVGKALNDPITGMTALRRAGVQLTAAQQEQVKAFVAVGNTLGAQKIILGELEKQFGGAAEAAADPAQKLSIAWGNLQEQLGEDLLPVLNSVVGVLDEGIDKFSALPAPVQQGVLAFVALAAVSGPLLTVGGNLKSIYDAATKIPSAAGSAASSLASMGTSGLVLGGLVGVVAAIGIAAESTAESIGSKLNKVFAELAELSGEELVEKFHASGDSLASFEAITSKSFGTAVRLRDELKEQGEETTKLDAIIEKYAEKQRNAEASTKAAATAVTGEDTAITELVPTVDDATSALKDLLDATLSAFDADVNYRQSLNSTEDALGKVNEATAEVHKTRGKDKEAVEALDRAMLDAEGTILRQADAIGDLAVKNSGLKDEADQAAVKIAYQKGELEKVRDTLAPDSPLRVRLNEYIAKLAAIPATVKTTIEQTFVSRGNDGTPIVRRKSGGPVDKGMPYWVGDAGGMQNAELFVPDQSGTILTQQQVGGGGGGSGATLVQAGPQQVVVPINIDGHLMATYVLDLATGGLRQSMRAA